MPAALRVRFLQKTCRPRGPLGASRLIASRMVFRHRARAQHRGLDKSDPREVCNETSPQLRKNGDSPRPTRRSPLPLAARPVPTRRRSVPTGNTTAPTGNATGRLGPFPKGDWGLHTGDSGDRRRLAEPTGRQGRQLAGATRALGRRLAAGRAATRCGEAPGPGPTRRCEMRRATTACAATSSAVPSYSRSNFVVGETLDRNRGAGCGGLT